MSKPSGKSSSIPAMRSATHISRSNISTKKFANLFKFCGSLIQWDEQYPPSCDASLLLGYHEILQFPGVLIGLDPYLLRLLVHLQLACRERCPFGVFGDGRKE